MIYPVSKEDIFRGNLILVNSEICLHSVESFECLECFSKFSNILLQKEVVLVLQKILKDLDAMNQIFPVSGYRTEEEQRKIFEDSLREHGKDYTLRFVAFPNHSEHQTGLAIDLTTDLFSDFICPSFPHDGIAEKFREVCYSYGFVERYLDSKQEITKIGAEEWHFRYVGVPHAELMKEKDFCLEEYLEFIRREQQVFFKGYEICYVPYYEGKTAIEMDYDTQISGDSMNGFILTRKCK